MMKPREWWIASPPSEDQHESMVCCDGPYGNERFPYENVKVIEKSAYNALSAELKYQKDQFKRREEYHAGDWKTLKDACDRLAAENETLRMRLAKHGGGK